jgi:hypothetical protein
MPPKRNTSSTAFRQSTRPTASPLSPQSGQRTPSGRRDSFSDEKPMGDPPVGRFSQSGRQSQDQLVDAPVVSRLSGRQSQGRESFSGDQSMGDPPALPQGRSSMTFSPRRSSGGTYSPALPQGGSRGSLGTNSPALPGQGQSSSRRRFGSSDRKKSGKQPTPRKKSGKQPGARKNLSGSSKQGAAAHPMRRSQQDPSMRRSSGSFDQGGAAPPLVRGLSGRTDSSGPETGRVQLVSDPEHDLLGLRSSNTRRAPPLPGAGPEPEPDHDPSGDGQRFLDWSTDSVDRARASIDAKDDPEFIRKAHVPLELIRYFADLTGPHEVTIFGLPGKKLHIYNTPEEVKKGAKGGAKKKGTYSNGDIIDVIEAVPIKWETTKFTEEQFPAVHALRTNRGWVKSRAAGGDRTVKKSFRHIDPNSAEEKERTARWKEFVGDEDGDEEDFAELAGQLEGSQAVVAMLRSKGVKFGPRGTAAGAQGVTARRPPLPGKSSGRRGGGTPPRRKKTKKRRKQSRRKTRGKRVGGKPRTRRS